MRALLLTIFGVWQIHSASAACKFCGPTPSHQSTYSFDLSTLPTESYSVKDVDNNPYYVASPCSNVNPPPLTCCSSNQGVSTPSTPMVEVFGNTCLELGALDGSFSTLSIAEDGQSFNVTLPANASSKMGPYCNRSSVYHFICDHSAPLNNPPNSTLVQHPGCVYNIYWRHPAACGTKQPSSSCSSPVIPARPAKPTPEKSSCLPTWTPTWTMWRSTMLYVCNHTGYYDPIKASKYGVVVIDWSSAEEGWTRDKPMTDEEMLTKQAKMVLEVDPGEPGGQQRVWVYRNTIKALP
eukprot:m.138993 g.138993  ORF g.138993 m.138993 type:complete len:294 (-) comp14787_c0_seq1:953-1834(-)